MESRPHKLSAAGSREPCQDISNAGKKKGLRDGDRSSLWFAFADRIRDLRPCVVVVENVEALLTAGRGFDAVLGSLSALGYAAEWDVVPAIALGAPQLRKRVFVVAWREDLESRLRGEDDVPGSVRGGRHGRPKLERDGRDRSHPGRAQERVVARRIAQGAVDVADAQIVDRKRKVGKLHGGAQSGRIVGQSGSGDQSSYSHQAADDMADAAGGGRHGSCAPRPVEDQTGRPGAVGGRSVRPFRIFDAALRRDLAVRNLVGLAAAWPIVSESGVGRTLTRTPSGSYYSDAWERGAPRFLAGVPARGQRLKAIGNSVVPPVAEYVWRCVLQAFPALSRTNP